MEIRQVKHSKRAMVMIFVVIMVAGMTTILAAVVDLGRMASLKQHQLERDAKWQYSVDSAKALVAQTLWDSAAYTQSFTSKINGMELTINSALDSWSSPNGLKMTATGVQEGKSRSATIYMGKRATVNPMQFAMFFTSKCEPGSDTTLTGDLYAGKDLVGSTISVTGDVYSSKATSPGFASLSGKFVGRQPKYKLSFNAASYASNASISTSGSTTLSNPANLLSLTKSQLRYHEGDLTIKGTVTGEITIFCKGSVTIQAIVPLTTILSRLVVICDGDITFTSGVSGVFALCSGKIITDSSGKYSITGAVAGSEFKSDDAKFTVIYDNYFELNSGGGQRYWIPGQW